MADRIPDMVYSRGWETPRHSEHIILPVAGNQEVLERIDPAIAERVVRKNPGQVVIAFTEPGKLDRAEEIIQASRQ